MKYILAFLFFLVSTESFAQKQDEQQILGSLGMQQKAWNEGNLEAFMDTYWNNDSLMFIGKSGITYGWKNTLANYKKGYPDTEAMGKLDFKILHLKKISDRYYSVVGKWYLTRSIGNVGGHFTLLFRKFKNKWLIVSDHSS